MPDPRFAFRPRWKEELVVTCAEGMFILPLDMGGSRNCANLPYAGHWVRLAPEWARGLWPALFDELTQWCHTNNTRLDIGAQGVDVTFRTPEEDEAPHHFQGLDRSETSPHQS
jgi:hypothetical protein